MSAVIREIESVIGKKGLPLLLTRYSGQKVCVPRPENLHGKHDLVTFLGNEVAKKFCTRFGGNQMYIPMNNAARIFSRNQAIIKDYSTGMTVNDLARRHGISIRTVAKALNGK
ncbi:MAG: hypothetical protein HQL07_04640 [Nitrospirae bacterium]|nr:hypothetical protein [Magnetococcales bacterium]HAT50777.1 hypothetical protein [Alphaproteobacteria bacterium]